MKESFDIPVVLFIFIRDKAVQVLERIAEIKPKRLYIMADNGRTDEEKELAKKCRQKVEDCITWDCEVIKNYAEENRGVWGNIAIGAEWVFQREEKAIFLEDDNLPEITFFEYCKEMLERYEDDNRILWVCGTNYLGEYKPEDGSSYVFTRHMLPCGWASWSKKFLKYYDKSLIYFQNSTYKKMARKNSYNYYLYRQYYRSWNYERKRIVNGLRPVSWDYQMDFSIKSQGLFGIAPCDNQITNIGIDKYSIHKGSNPKSIMLQRFCGIPTKKIEFPLKHPSSVMIDPIFEKKIAKVVSYPIRVRFENLIHKLVKVFAIKKGH